MSANEALVENQVVATVEVTCAPGSAPAPAPAPIVPGAEATEPLSPLELLKDVELNVRIELGRARLPLEEVLKLGERSVVQLDRLADDPVDVYVNDRLIARGEVVVINDKFAVRVTEILAGAKGQGT